MKGRRSITFVTLIVVLTLLLGGCAQQSAIPSGSDQAAGKTIVRQWEYSADPNALTIAQQMVEKFNAQSDTIEVRLELVPRDIVQQKLLAAIQAGDPPDLVRFDLPWTPQFASAGNLVDLTDKINSWGQIDDYYPYSLETAKYNDKFYGLPSDMNNLALFYNKDMADAAGITEAPKTWEDLYSDAQKLTVTTSGTIDVAGLIFGGKKNETIPFDWFPWLWQAGGDVATINSAAGVSALDQWVKYIDDGITPEGTLNWGHTEMAQQFEAGKAAMMINGTAYVAQVKSAAPDLNFGIWNLPCDKDCATVVGGEDWVIPNGSKVVDAAWTVLQYYSSPDILQWWCTSTNTIPSRQSVAQSSAFTDDPILKVFVDQMSVARPRPVDPRYSEISDAVQVAVQAALTHQQTSQQALDTAEQVISGILK